MCHVSDGGKKYPPHVFFVLACTHISDQAIGVELIRSAIKQGVAWPAVMAFAIPHGVLPLMAHNLQRFTADLLPDAMLTQLERYRKTVEERNTRHWLSLNQITGSLLGAGIRALGYKGPSLALTAYGSLALREFHDLDLWADPDRTEKAGEVLRSLGFLPAIYKDGQPLPSESSAKVHREFVSADGETVVDFQHLRHSYQMAFRPDFDELWERRINVNAYGISVPSLSREDLLPALSVHGSKHAWRRLNWVVDVAGVLAAASEDEAARGLERSVTWRCQRRVLSAVALASELYPGTPYSDSARRALPTRQTARSAAYAIQQIARPDAPRTTQDDMARLRFRLRELDTVSDRLSFVRVKFSGSIRHFPSMVGRAG